MITKEEVLQKVNEYCSEKSYTVDTLSDGFKDKFADHFVKANESGDINDEAVIGNLKFALNSAFSSASDIATSKARAFETKENDYKNQIAELNKKLGANPNPQPQPIQIPDEIKTQLAELERFKNEEQKKVKYANIVAIAKKGIRSDLHSSFDKFAKTQGVSIDKDDESQAKDLLQAFQDIYKDSIGDIRPFTPKQIQHEEDEIINGVKKVIL